MEERREVSGITVQGRHRKDLGDINALAESIGTVGLLHPVAVSADNVLIAGELVDFHWPAQRLVVEIDSWLFHKTRRQFDVPIGSFQALRHRAAKLFCELELARSAVMHAARTVDEARDDAAIARAASLAKARCADAFVLAGYEGVQMHGGIGMTDEHDIGFFLKRARAAQLTCGDAAWHRDRMARLDGY